MKKTLLILALSLLPAYADSIADAAAQLHAGKPADALQALAGEQGAAADFWRGRALIGLGRLAQAVEPLQRVPQEHALYPYAAKALLYCAWQSDKVDPDTVLPPLLNSGNEEIRTLATAALAEYHLNRNAAADTAALMQHLHERAEADENLRPLLNLLTIADLRRKGDFEAAIAQCRRLERDRSLPLLTRHRVRLALAEVYYDQEEAAQTEKPANAPAETDEDEDAEDPTLPDTPVARGRGEETLLHFISSNPESPLLEEAFRRLMLHEAFLSGEGARERLKEWGNNLRYPRRAALSLLVQQRLLNPEDAGELAPDATCVNVAAAALPKESATDTMLLEQVRLQLQRGNRTEAALYLASVQAPSPRRDFLAAGLIDNPAKASRAFLDIAHAANDELQYPAYYNALLYALRAGDRESAESIERESDLRSDDSSRLCGLMGAYLTDSDPAAAEACLKKLREGTIPRDLLFDVLLDTTALQLEHPELFENTPFNAEEAFRGLALSDISEEQLLRFIALREQRFRAAGDTKAALDSIILALAATKQGHPQLYAVLCIHLSHLLSAEERHEEALRVLQQLTEEQPKGELTPRARMLAARQAELVGTLASLRSAAEIYGICAETNADNAPRCALRRAAVLARIGETTTARAIIDERLRSEDSLSKEDRMIAYAVLANILVQEGTPESLQQAVHAAAHMLGEPELSPRHQAFTLLHHGMICIRAGKDNLALGDYLAVLRMKPADTSTMDARDMKTLHRAAAGAVYAYCQLEQFEEAAKLADEAAEWPTPPESDFSAAKQGFAAWAHNIRQSNYLAD